MQHNILCIAGYVSMTSASTYLIDATAADPVIVPGDMYPYQNGYTGPAHGYSVPPNGYAGHSNGYAGPSNGYAGPSNGYAKGYGGASNGYADGSEDDERARPLHCNHMNDSCQCFNQHYAKSTKVKWSFEFFIIYLKMN